MLTMPDNAMQRPDSARPSPKVCAWLAGAVIFKLKWSLDFIMWHCNIFCLAVTEEWTSMLLQPGGATSRK